MSRLSFIMVKHLNENIYSSKLDIVYYD